MSNDSPVQSFRTFISQFKNNWADFFTTKNSHSHSLILIGFFFGIIFLVPSYWVINLNNQPERSIIEYRNLQRFSIEELGFKTLYINLTQKQYSEFGNLLNDILVNRTIPKRVEDAAQDQFPLRLPLIRLERELERALASIAYLPLNDDVIPIGLSSDTYYVKEHNFLISPPVPFTEEAKTIMDQRIENYSDLVSLYPNKNFYVYFVKRIQYSELNPLIDRIEVTDINWPVNYFVNHKPESLMFDTLDFSSFSEYVDAFCKTDGHWNNHGVQQAYYEVFS